jgi:hypothetical protein
MTAWDTAAAKAAEEVAAASPEHPWQEVQAREAASWQEEERSQAELLRDIFGNFFRPVVLDPAWMAWNGGTVKKLAQAIYDDRAFDQLPILADALEEAACKDATILKHLREPGPHCLGCWAVSLVLGKE